MATVLGRVASSRIELLVYAVRALQLAAYRCFSVDDRLQRRLQSCGIIMKLKDYYDLVTLGPHVVTQCITHLCVVMDAGASLLCCQACKSITHTIMPRNLYLIISGCYCFINLLHF